MNIVLGYICGLIVATMNMLNSQLSQLYSIYLATFIIHIMGLLTFIIIMYVQKERFILKKGIGKFCYGGVVGILTVMFNAMSIAKLGITMVSAISFMGQMLTSLIIETLGCFKTQKQSLTIQKGIGLIVAGIGVGVMFL